MMIYQKKMRRRRSRKGAAVVEFAVCLPVIILIVMGSIESASMLFLKQTLIQASYEGAKTAIGDNSKAEVRSAIRAVGQGRKVKGMKIAFQPRRIQDAVPGDIITITVSAPGDANSFIPFGLFKNKTVVASASMVKE